MTGELSRLAAVSDLAFRGSLRGLRALGLATFAAVPSLLVLAIASARPPASSLASSAEALFGVLTLPIVIMLIVLVIAVAQFRNEIDAETLVYLSSRSVGRPTLVLGKYLGACAASIVLAVPATLVPLGVAEAAGGTPYPAAVPGVVLATVLLAVVAYVAVFLFLGLVTRSALAVGLIFGFLWEELLDLLPGEAPRLTIVYYLRAVLSGELRSGPLSAYPTVVSSAGAAATVVGVVVVFVIMATAAFRFLETAPVREPG